MNMDFLIPIAIMGCIVYVIKNFSDNRVRHKLIERGQLDDSVKYLYMDKGQNRRLVSLRWGLFLVAIGLALIVGQVFGSEISETITIGCMLLFAGIGFFVYYHLTKYNSNEMSDNKISVE